jgi:hypothetical protein
LNAQRARLAALTGAAALTLLLVGSFFLPAESPDADLETTAVSRDAQSTSQPGSENCRQCHSAIYAEWEGSPHAQAFTDPEVRRLSNDFANQDCLDCHVPLPVFETGIGQRVLPRELHREQGVDCLACHALPQTAGGGVAARRDLDAPCRPRARAELHAPEHCGGCHDQHGTIGQWRASPAAAAGRSCVDCHMSKDPLTGKPSHRMPGGSSLELVRSAVALAGSFDGSRWIARVTNHGAGHNFPTDERSRAGDVFWRPLVAAADASGQPAWRHVHRFRSPYRHETGLVDTTLPAGQSGEYEISVEAGTSAIEIALFYKRTPFWLDPAAPDPEVEARLVHRVEVRRP